MGVARLYRGVYDEKSCDLVPPPAHEMKTLFDKVKMSFNI